MFRRKRSLKIDGIDEAIRTSRERLRHTDWEIRDEAKEKLIRLAEEGGDFAKSRVAQEFAACFDDADAGVRESAEWGLRECGEAAHATLLASLDNQNPLIRKHAASACGRCALDEVLMHALRRALDDHDADVRDRAAWSLGQLRAGDLETISKLSAMIQSAVASDRSASLHALANIAKELGEGILKPFADVVIRATDDENNRVRWAALYAIQGLKPEVQVYLPIAIRRANDADGWVAKMAISALSNLADKTDVSGAVPVLCDVLDRCNLEDRDEAAMEACELLAKLGPAAKDGVKSVGRVLHSATPQLACTAATALWTIDRRVNESLPVLSKWLKGDLPECACNAISAIGPAAAALKMEIIATAQSDDYDVAWAATDALGDIASYDPQVLEALVNQLGHPSSIVRSSAVRGLANFGAAAVPALVASLDIIEDTRAEWSIDALSRIGPEAIEAIERLKELMSHDGPYIRYWSSIALGKIARSKDVVPWLSEILVNEPALRGEAAQALQSIGPDAHGAIPALKTALEDHDNNVREAVRSALEEIGRRARAR
jgi:HEAT repeat protein